MDEPMVPCKSETQTSQSEPQSEPQDSQSAPAPAMREEQTARMDRVQDYLACTLQNDDHLLANLGSLSAGLMRLGLHLEQAIEISMTATPMVSERLQKILGPIETHLRLMRQIDRFANLEQQITKGQYAKESVYRADDSQRESRASEGSMS